MSARKRKAPTDAPAATDASGDPAPGPYTEATSLLFDPNVLLSRVFFLDPDKTRYISIGFYPSRNYQPLVEIGTPKQHPILPTEQHVSTLAELLPGQVDALWRDELYTVRDADFSMHSATTYKTAVLTLGVKQNRKSVFLKLQELRYLHYIFPIVMQQMARYIDAMGDVMNYFIAAASSTAYVAPPLGASKHILYSQLYEEVKTLL